MGTPGYFKDLFLPIVVTYRILLPCVPVRLFFFFFFFFTGNVIKMRIPYTPDPPEPVSMLEEAIVSRIEARRAPRPLQSLDLALLHSPPVADGWNSFLGAIRTQTTLPADLRELAICRVAVCNKAWYEWKHHAPLAMQQGGVSKEAMEVVKRDQLGERDGLLSDKQWAVVVYTNEMTRNVHVSEAAFALIRELFNDREITEITATVSVVLRTMSKANYNSNLAQVAAYNCVSRFLVALDGRFFIIPFDSLDI